MNQYWLGSVLDHVLLQDLKSLASRDRATTADLLAYLAEVEARGLYRQAACESMHRYCVRVLCMSEDIAFKRLAVARSAREFPALFERIADGRLNLSSALMLKPHLTAANADELLAAAANQTNEQVALLIAERFPQPDVEYRLALPAPISNEATADPLAVRRVAPSEAPAAAKAPVPVSTTAPPARPRVAPLSADRCALQATIRRSTHDKLRYAEDLLGHAVPHGDFDAVLERALDALIHEIEKRRFGKGSRARRATARVSSDPDYIPMHVRREVFLRDGGRCTFTSHDGHRCGATRRLEFDHKISRACGGESTVPNLRLRCQAHNQLAVEQAFGAGTMREKREAARAERARARKHVRIAPLSAGQPDRPSPSQDVEPAPPHAGTDDHPSRSPHTGSASPPHTAAVEHPRLSPPAESAPPHATPAEHAPPPPAPDLEVIPWLRSLRISAAEARRGAELCAHMKAAPLEARVRFAIASLAPPSARPAAPFARSAP